MNLLLPQNYSFSHRTHREIHIEHIEKYKEYKIPLRITTYVFYVKALLCVLCENIGVICVTRNMKYFFVVFCSQEKLKIDPTPSI